MYDDRSWGDAPNIEADIEGPEITKDKIRISLRKMKKVSLRNTFLCSLIVGLHNTFSYHLVLAFFFFSVRSSCRHWKSWFSTPSCSSPFQWAPLMLVPSLIVTNLFKESVNFACCLPRLLIPHILPHIKTFYGDR